MANQLEELFSLLLKTGESYSRSKNGGSLTFSRGEELNEKKFEQKKEGRLPLGNAHQQLKSECDLSDAISDSIVEIETNSMQFNL